MSTKTENMEFWKSVYLAALQGCLACSKEWRNEQGAMVESASEYMALAEEFADKSVDLLKLRLTGEEPIGPAINHPGEWVHDWARWRAQDSDGRWIEFFDKPDLDEYEWLSGGRAEYVVHDDAETPAVNWRNTLEKRK